MATGSRNKLTGQIGEHLVAAKLGTMGFIAAPFSGNVPGFDLTAVDTETGRQFVVQVKTSRDGGAAVHSTINKWAEHSIDDDGYQTVGGLLPLDHPDRIWVMVHFYNDDITTARYFVMTEAQVQDKTVARFVNFMKRYNFRRPSGSRSTQSILDVKDIVEFEDN